MAVTEKQKEQLFEALKTATHSFAVKNKFIKEKEKKIEVDPDLQKLADLTHQLGGCSADEFREMIALLLKVTSGKSLPIAIVKKAEEDDGLSAVKYAVITLVGNHNNHNYGYGPNKVPILIHQPDSDMAQAKGITGSHFEGNWLPLEFECDVKPATDKEIKDFIEEFTAKASSSELVGKIIAGK